MHAIDVAPDGRERIHPENAAQWRDWLAAHHGRGAGVWVVTWRSPTDDAALTYEQIVRECLCFGWIDATTGAVDADRHMRWCSPRKRGSGWARTNKARVAELEEAGLMQTPGAAVIAAAKDDGSWTVLDDAEALVVPADLADALAASPTGREFWDAMPPSARKLALTQVALAKREATRAQRVVRIADAAARGVRPY